MKPCCDLLSDLFFTIFATARFITTGWCNKLWFAFRFIFYDICNSHGGFVGEPDIVVICFQIYFLRYLQQHGKGYEPISLGCDLLSDLFFTIFATASDVRTMQATQLWFAFRFIFYDICNSKTVIGILNATVVICFQIYFLRYLQQHCLLTDAW